MDAWKLFLIALRAYLRTIGSELLENFYAGEFLPPFPQYLFSEIQAWLPEWLMEIFVPAGHHSATEKSRDISEMVTPDYDQSETTPLKSKKKKQKVIEEEKAAEEYNIWSLSSLVPDPEVFD